MTANAKSSKITILGGGLAGLVLARVLYINGIDAIIYEGEGSMDVRGQGGLLDIHEYNGQLAIKSAGLYEKFLDIILEGADAQRIVDKDANILYEDQDRGNGTRPEVHREELRKMLIESIPEEKIKWGHRVDKVFSLGEGKHEVHFTNGEVVLCDYLVGADGAWSKVRPLLTNIKPNYVGITLIEMYLFDTEKKHKKSSEIAGLGTLMALSPEKGILAHKEKNGTLHAYVAFRKPIDWINQIDFSDKEASTSFIENEFKDWAGSLRSIISNTEVTPVPRSIYALPVNHRFKHKKGVTLIGDAAHLMSPFAGEGANLALYDGAELAKAIIKRPSNIEAAFIEYEEEMFIRTTDAAIESDRNAKLFFNEDSPQNIVDMFARFKKD